MCDYFSQRMDGDLTDIVLTGGHLSNSGLDPFLDDDANWQVDQLLPNSDPFADLQVDPMLNPYVPGGATGVDHGGFGDRFQLLPPPPPPKAVAAKVHQISLSPLLPKMITAGGPMAGAADRCGEEQISPRRATTPGNKRRKGQAKRVVYVPAPAAAAAEGSNRPSGEVVPSDLWAWRKYGQKPIKGSPYPRGYYRCSSSKGCSARKQVERSRADPNMLVVTYTSEHNHPWPTQRNALAGSVRSSHHSKSIKPLPPPTDATATDPLINHPDAEALAPPASTSPLVNEESGVCYKPMIPEANLQADDFFSDLAELESEPMSLIFSKTDPLFSMFD
ncbi:probable WRKY transcription factor 14 [Zingiber officinale]|uniref:WRKY domain-containing protein n=1 Tax=Zingiber officinale TaxID=94328 RepID=A0A8J5L3L8_ZINOF|nr:probable WRKY transcription factor 14 [Zingiber officinale]KAG6504312.1 hypothetical protein ZIOFF_036643 [Zingiber officinale]